jgi:hypothetical protein
MSKNDVWLEAKELKLEKISFEKFLENSIIHNQGVVVISRNYS